MPSSLSSDGSIPFGTTKIRKTKIKRRISVALTPMWHVAAARSILRRSMSPIQPLSESTPPSDQILTNIPRGESTYGISCLTAARAAQVGQRNTECKCITSNVRVTDRAPVSLRVHKTADAAHLLEIMDPHAIHSDRMRGRHVAHAGSIDVVVKTSTSCLPQIAPLLTHERNK
jgi:hypothetical protein